MRTADARYSDRDQIKIGVDGGAYTTITADTLVDNTTGYDSYHCRADITDLVRANPLKAIYYVADMYARTSGTNNFGGWNIVVVYKNDLETMRNLTVYDGVANVEALTDVEINIDGFLTPPVGPVTFDIGVFGYDGDRGFVGDGLEFDGGAGYQNISNTTNPVNDIFNFSITKRDVISTSQIPLKLNNISIDADIFSPDNSSFDFIGNSETSADIRVTTGGETVLSQVITLAIDVYEPDVRASVTVEDLNGGDAFPGDTLRYTVKGINIGSDPGINTYLTDTLEENINYVPNSIEITHGPNSGAKTDVIGDDQAEWDLVNRTIKVRIGTGADGVDGGTVLNDPTGLDSTVFTFLTVVEEDCINLFCDNIVDNQAFIFATGPSSGIEFNNGSNPGVFDADGCPINGTTQTPIDISGCVIPPDTTVATYCSNVVFADFPYEGYDYFDDTYTSVTEASGAGTYYAIYEAYAGCLDTIVITITDYVAGPTVANAGADQTACEVPGTATLAGNDPVVGTGEWTVLAGGASIDDRTDFASEVSGLTPGINTFQWAISTVTCPESDVDEITINVDASPTTSNAGADQTICEDPGTATLAGNDPAVGTGTWTLISGAGTITDASAYNSGVTDLDLGDNVFRWTIGNGVCTDSFDEVTLTVVAEPSTSNAGADQTICEDPGTATLAGNDPAVGTGTWTLVSGTGTITDATAFNSGLTGLGTGDNVFRWTIENGACTDSFDEVIITVDESPSTAAAGADQTVCEVPGTATLDGNNPLLGTGTWTVIAGDGTVTVPGDFNSGVTGLSVGVNTFRWTISNGVCSDSFDEITINVDEAPSTADAGEDQSICESPGTATLAGSDQTVCSDPGTTTLEGNEPSVGTGTWTLISLFFFSFIEIKI